jgi:7 transmembrane helices usually fused to an inactive transglutaminase
MLSQERRRPRARRWSAEHWRFLGLMLIPASLIALGRVHGLPTNDFLDRHLALTGTPPGLQHTLQDVLLVPFGALVVVFFRLTLGIRLLGPFRSILLAFAFLVTGISLGLLFLAITILILILARPAVKALHLPYFGRVSVMISAVAAVMVLAVLAGGWIRSASLQNVAHFPIVVLVLVGEKVAVTMKREGIRSGLWRAATTAAVGIALTAIASIPGLGGLLLGHPELLLVEIALIVVVSTLGAWRLLARLNPGAAASPPTQVGAAGNHPQLAGAPRA